MRRKIRVVGAMIEQDGKYLITQRPPRASLPLLWEFPGGRVEIRKLRSSGGERQGQQLIVRREMIAPQPANVVGIGLD